MEEVKFDMKPKKYQVIWQGQHNNNLKEFDEIDEAMHYISKNHYSAWVQGYATLRIIEDIGLKKIDK